MKKSIVFAVMALSATLISPVAMAEKSQMRKSYSADVTRSNDQGRSMHRHTEQVANQYRYQRQTQVMTGSGKSAERNVSASYDPEHQTMTKEMSRTGFDGEQHNRSVVRTRDGDSTQ